MHVGIIIFGSISIICFQGHQAPMSFPSRILTSKPRSSWERLVGADGGLEISIAGSCRSSGIRPFPIGDTSCSPSSGEKSLDVAAFRENNDVFLTWQDLWVFTSGKKEKRVPVISGLTGLAQPGQILAIMGPSGCGKTTLLDSLAGRLATNLGQTGEILINGQKQALAFGTSAYVTQEDVLMTTLTVKEAVHYAAELQLPSTMSRAAKRYRAEETLQEMGLAGVADVRIGGRTSKGISGGQRRRVSICMELITRPKLLFLDEPTSGLDSAASFHVIKRIAMMAARERMTVAASVHQPGTEVFDLFNSVCILAYGRTVFFGPPASAPEFFAVNGFPIPSLKNPSDHYLKTINKDFDRDIGEGDQAKSSGTIEAIKILVNSYALSEISQQSQMKIDRIQKLGGGDVRKRGHSDFVSQCIVLTRRSFVNMYRDLGYYWLRFAIYVGLCLCVGTVYYNIGNSYGSIQARGSVLMFIVSFLTFMAIGGFPSFVEDMKIFNRERLNGHYGVGCFTISNTVSATPFLALISVVPGGIAYYIVGLQSGIYHFTYFVLVLFSCMMLVEGMMMIVASIVPDFLMGVITGAGIQGMMILSGGFFRLPQDLPKPVWRYPMYYAAFHKYAYQGFYKNEFFGLTFPTNIVGNPPTITGEEILKEVWHVEMGYSKWVDLGVLLGMVVLYRVIFFVIVKAWETAWPALKGLMYNRASRESENHKVAEVVAVK